MKKICALCLIIGVLLCVFPVFAADAEDLSIVNGCNTLDGRVPVLGDQKRVENALSVILYEANTDTLMHAYHADEQLSPSSLTKILTALIAIEKGSMDDVVTVRADVLRTLDPDAATVGLKVDEVVTVKDLLYCMMVASGNDAAVVLADHVMGNQKAFVTEMNRYVSELGCTNTHFTNVHGLHDDEQYTTARDMAKILAKAIQNKLFCEAFGAKEYAMPQTNKSNARRLVSQNYLLNNSEVEIYFDSRVTGGRTAVANDRSRSLATTARVNGMNLVCIVMGAASKYQTDGYTVEVFGGYNETKQLLDLGFNGHKGVQILHSGQVLRQSSVENGTSDVIIGTGTEAFAVIPDAVNTESLFYRFVDEVPLRAPIQKGDRLSTVQVWNGTICIAQADLYAMNTVKAIGTERVEQDPGEKETEKTPYLLFAVGAVVVIVLLSFTVLYFMRAVRIAKMKKQSRRNSRNRRRSR